MFYRERPPLFENAEIDAPMKIRAALAATIAFPNTRGAKNK